MEYVLKAIGVVVLFLGLLVVIGLLMSYPVMWMVNYLFAPTAIHAVFGVDRITFWQAFVLNLLFCGSLFKSSSSSSSKK